MDLVWLLDRATGLLAYPTLYLAVLTGIFFNEPAFGRLYDLGRRVHVEIATLATVLVLAHGVIGLLDAGLVVSGAAPTPSYGLTFLVGGVAIGIGALVLTTVAVLGFLDPARFERPWGPRAVHAFAYGGFVFATLHGIAVGSDVAGVPTRLAVLGLAFLGYVLVLRLLVRVGLATGGTGEVGDVGGR